MQDATPGRMENENTVVDLRNRNIVVTSVACVYQKTKIIFCQEKEAHMRGGKFGRKQFVWMVFSAVLLTILGAGAGMAAEKKLKAGFIYVGPVGDYGWSHAHDMGRKYAEKQLPWLETLFVESVG